MNEYNKIQTVFLRSPESNYKNLMEGEWALPEFDYLKNNTWVWTEKVDGTNIRIMWDGQTVRFGGKTDDAQIPTFLLRVLQDTFTPEKMEAAFGNATAVLPGQPLPQVCLYGEGYGAKIQKGGGNYIPTGTNFILFDCKIGEWWLQRANLEDIAEKLCIRIVPIVGRGTLTEAVEFCKNGFKSVIASNPDHDAEGLVMKPETELANRKGDRIIAKIKHKDFILVQPKKKQHEQAAE